MSEFFDGDLDDIGVAAFTGPAETSNVYRLAVPKSLAELEHPVAQTALVRAVAVSKTCRVGDKRRVPANAFWCNFVPPGRKQTKFRGQYVSEIESSALGTVALFINPGDNAIVKIWLHILSARDP